MGEGDSGCSIGFLGGNIQQIRYKWVTLPRQNSICTLGSCCPLGNV